MIDNAWNLFDSLAIVVGAVALLWLALRSRRPGDSGWSAGAVIGLLAWVAASAFALYLIFG